MTSGKPCYHRLVDYQPNNIQNNVQSQHKRLKHTCTVNLHVDLLEPKHVVLQSLKVPGNQGCI